jgi:hypothetical protein
MTSREVADALKPLTDRLYIAGAISDDELKILLAARERLGACGETLDGTSPGRSVG